MDEPTAVLTPQESEVLMQFIHDFTKQGNSVIYASCENGELLSITDRIYVLYDGSVTAELETRKTNEDEIMHYAVGSTSQYA